MFDPLPEHPPHMAGRFLFMFGAAGGLAAVMLVGLVFGMDRIANSNAWLIPSFVLGVGPGLWVGAKVLLPSSSSPGRASRPGPREVLPSLSSPQLIDIEARLNTSLWLAVAAVAATLGWALFSRADAPGWVGSVLVLTQLGAYIWFAICVGGAAAAVGERKWAYVTWVMAAPDPR